MHTYANNYNKLITPHITSIMHYVYFCTFTWAIKEICAPFNFIYLIGFPTNNLTTYIFERDTQLLVVILQFDKTFFEYVYCFLYVMFLSRLYYIIVGFWEGRTFINSPLCKINWKLKNKTWEWKFVSHKTLFSLSLVSCKHYKSPENKKWKYIQHKFLDVCNGFYK